MTEAAQNLMKVGSRKLCEMYDTTNDQEFQQAFHQEMASRHPIAYANMSNYAKFRGSAFLAEILANLQPGIEELYI